MTKSPSSVPAIIEGYQAAHDRHDVSAALDFFVLNAVVHDDGENWTGAKQIQRWLTKTSSEYTYTRTLISAESTGEASWLVRNRLEGNFPGGVVELRYEFVIDGDRITELTIAP